MKQKKILLMGILSIIMAFLATGCSDDKQASDEQKENKISLAYPITIDGTEIKIRETTIGELLNNGFEINVLEQNETGSIDRYTIDLDTRAEPDTYYSGGTLSKDNILYGNIALITDKSVDTLKDAVIARLEIRLGTNEFDPKDISFANIPLSELTFDKANEELKGLEALGNLKNLMSGRDDEYDISLQFNPDGGVVVVSVEGIYDIDFGHK